MILDICLSPALYPFYKKENDTVIVVDIFRASTTMCATFANGASAIIPVADVEEAKRYKSQGYPVGAERNTRKCDFADFGNSPFDYSREKVEGKEIVFTTTNGTHAIKLARGCKTLLIGAFSNIDALANKCREIGNRIVVICAGWNNRVNIEDTLFGGAFAEKLSGEHPIKWDSDAVKIAWQLWQFAKHDPLNYIKDSEHYQRLIDNKAEGDAFFCLQPNTTNLVPYYDRVEKKLKIY
jgi:2-phosphosulfolactate phosphatase